uniref:L27 domain-containing protein n=1 Tax=Gasterosteus aculeatus aculeatus TaxID=481459 RepID=A0AAQ4QN84_GASAC
MLSRTEHRGVCRLISSVMSGTESHTDREEDYRFLHSMLMEKKLHLLFKIHERLRRFEKRGPVPVQDHAAGLASDLAEELICQCGRDRVKELAALLSKPNFKSLLSVHDAVAQRDFEPSLPPLSDDSLEDDQDSVKIVSLVKTKDPLPRTPKCSSARSDGTHQESSCSSQEFTVNSSTSLLPYICWDAQHAFRIVCLHACAFVYPQQNYGRVPLSRIDY